MPPLPSSFDSATAASISSIGRRQIDLTDFQIPRLRACRESLTVQQQHAAEIREDLDSLTHAIEALEEAVEEQRGARARRDLRGVVEEFRTKLANLRKDARSALLASKRAIDTQNASKREELLRSSVMKTKQTSGEKTAEDALMKANNDVTDTLHRTMGLMQGELERSVLSVQMLESSTKTLSSTSITHDVLTGMLGTSKHLITALEKSDWLDRLLILAALAFFIVIVLFILKQRIFDRGVRIAFWWTRFLPDMGGGTGKGMAGALNRAEAGSFSPSASSVVAAAATSVSAAAMMASSGSKIVSQGLNAVTASPVTGDKAVGHISDSLEQVLGDVTFSETAPTPLPAETAVEMPRGPDTDAPGTVHDEL
ncbi:hypothetical protein EWM64_g2619 [Hericium alpestre]|uniref:Sec20 C-terminal domain-containing protein n=1 Tax=Hericium alpestre TaxID=135208 RepID=A0A4Z0A2Y2_9AGAM|nr:hypothetical protein EWM64_g2619 [Hericium alpestre]